MSWQLCTSGCTCQGVPEVPVLYLGSAQLPVSSQFWVWFICRLLQEFPQAGLCLPDQPVALPGSGNCWDQQPGKGRAVSVLWDTHHWLHGQTAKIPTLCVWLILFTSSVPFLVWRIGHEKALWKGIGMTCPGTKKTLNKEEQQSFPKCYSSASLWNAEPKFSDSLLNILVIFQKCLNNSNSSCTYSWLKFFFHTKHI